MGENITNKNSKVLIFIFIGLLEINEKQPNRPAEKGQRVPISISQKKWKTNLKRTELHLLLLKWDEISLVNFQTEKKADKIDTVMAQIKGSFITAKWE